MPASPTPFQLAPFDAIALQYDETFTSSRIGMAQRAAVWSELQNAFCQGDRILEIGCGTGVDACFLAERGVRVVACDSSSRMIAVTTRRILDSRLQNLVCPLVLPAEEISSLPPGDLFDGAFSNFGALNCIDSLERFACDLAVRLKPGATALLCWMGSYCLWETIWYLMNGSRQKAFRRLKRDGVSAKIAEGTFVRVHYPTLSLITSAFAPQFRVKSIRGIGVAVPPSYLESLAQRHPRLLRFCERADSVIGRWPGIRLVADHILVGLQRVGTQGVHEQ